MALDVQLEQVYRFRSWQHVIELGGHYLKRLSPIPGETTLKLRSSTTAYAQRRAAVAIAVGARTPPGRVDRDHGGNRRPTSSARPPAAARVRSSCARCSRRAG